MTECQSDTAFTRAMQILVDEGFGSIAECITIGSPSCLLKNKEVRQSKSHDISKASHGT